MRLARGVAHVGTIACRGRHSAVGCWRGTAVVPFSRCRPHQFRVSLFGHEFRAFTGLMPTRYVEVRRRFLREHPGHALDGWPLPAD